MLDGLLALLSSYYVESICKKLNSYKPNSFILKYVMYFIFILQYNNMLAIIRRDEVFICVQCVHVYNFKYITITYISSITGIYYIYLRYVKYIF